MGFKPGKLMTALVAVFLPLTLTLGWWQLSRAAEKNQWLSELAEHSEAVVQWQADVSYAIGQPVALCVQPTGESWYLDNRTHEGQPGYEVFLPAQDCVDRSPLLLRLGWLGQQNGRAELPEVASDGTAENIDITGVVRPAPPAPWLSAAPEDMGNGRWRFQSMDDAPNSEFSNGVPVIQVTTPDNWQLVDNWDPVNYMPPERHVGYAIQWFGLALALVVCFVVWGRKQSNRFSSIKGNETT